MAKTRGRKGAKSVNRAPKAPSSAIHAPPKRRSTRIATGTGKRTCTTRLKVPVTISDDTTISRQSSDQTPSPPFSPAPSFHEHDSTSTPPPTFPQGSLLNIIPGDWLRSLASQDRFHAFKTKPISICEKLDVPLFTSKKLGFFENLVKDNCVKLLELGNVVYSRLVKLFYANLEITPSPKGIILVSNVKGAVLGSIFSLKFTEIAPSSLTQKKAKDLCLVEYACPDKLVE